MCLIIVCENRNASLPDYIFSSAQRKNANGFGITWYEKNKVRVFKSADGNASFKEAFLARQKFASPTRPLIGHLRLATSGSVSMENCHPFKIKSALGTHYLYHNGVLSPMYLTEGQSDTAELARVLSKWATDDPKGWLQRALEILESVAGGSNRFAIVKPDGSTALVGDFHLDYAGFRLSNRYAYDAPLGSGFWTGAQEKEKKGKKGKGKKKGKKLKTLEQETGVWREVSPGQWRFTPNPNANITSPNNVPSPFASELKYGTGIYK